MKDRIKKKCQCASYSYRSQDAFFDAQVVESVLSRYVTTKTKYGASCLLTLMKYVDGVVYIQASNDTIKVEEKPTEGKVLSELWEIQSADHGQSHIVGDDEFFFTSPISVKVYLPL